MAALPSLAPAPKLLLLRPAPPPPPHRSLLFADSRPALRRALLRGAVRDNGCRGRRGWGSARAVLDLGATGAAIKTSDPRPRERPKVAHLEDILSERGACGVGFIANLQNKASHKTIVDALTALGCMEHRGGCGADNDSGDGAGLMTSVPWDIYDDWVKQQGLPSLDKSHTGVGMVFLPKDEKHMEEAKTVIMNIFLEEGLEVLGWRPVPVNALVVGRYAKETMPNIQQVFVKVPKEENIDDIERELYICRKLIERATTSEEWSNELYFCSLSNQTIVYKGMLRSQVLGQFYLDLQNELYKSPFAIYHRRYSTNTSPRWPLAQPMRLLGHNGEINTIQGNLNWMQSREATIKSPVWRGRENEIRPYGNPKASDSANLDSAAELLLRSGRSPAEALMILVPEGYKNHPTLMIKYPEVVDFYDYYKGQMEAWDGPALLLFSDGKTVGACLDRNGLRPARYWLQAPEENFKVHTEIFLSDGKILRPCNTNELLERHLKVTGGKVFTRFPPEPNGYLHIGHAKAMYVDFGLAKERGGSCYLRFDDTNPEAEKGEYTDHIKEIVQWMGWQPFKVTYTSDYFQDLYDLAVKLISDGHAYVDHQTPEEIKEYREKKMESKWRDRPVEESLQLFDEMRRGMFEEGKATLRLKQDMKSDNKNMCDLIAYRIKFTPHPHAGDKWCIYPSYDYAHCIVDSIENITHSLCTLEFEIRRASYYWLLQALGIYQPYVWEYSRLNISNTVMSKRKLNRLVTEGWVDGWDDPRLMTLAGLRRRGVSPTSINTFVRGLGITRSDHSLIHVSRLEYYIREELNKSAPRTMVVLHPLKVVITNLDCGSITDLDAKMWPDAPASDPSSFYKVPFTNVVYIERSDFRLEDSKDFYGLAPGKSVLLRYAFPIECTGVEYGSSPDEVVEIRAKYDPSKTSKPKGVLHWVAQPSPGVEPLKVEVRLFEQLFRSQNPAELEDWLSDLNPQSKEVITGAYAVPSLSSAVLGSKFQFERLGYFAVDPDTTPEKLVFNRIVTLRDSYVKGGNKDSNVKGGNK